MCGGSDPNPVVGRAGVATRIEAVDLLDGVAVSVRAGNRSFGQHVVLESKESIYYNLGNPTEKGLKRASTEFWNSHPTGQCNIAPPV